MQKHFREREAAAIESRAREVGAINQHCTVKTEPQFCLNHDFDKIFRINKIKKTLCELREKTLCTLWFSFLPQRTQGIHKGHKKNPANLINLMKISVLTIFLCLSFGAKAQTWNIGYPNPTSVTATLSGSTLTISGNGAMADYNPPWST